MMDETDEGMSFPLGNTIRNSNNIQLSSQLNLTNLYNKVDYFKNLNRKYNTKKRQSGNKNNKRTERFNKNDVSLEEGKPYTLNHGLKTKDVTVRVFDKNGRTVPGETEVVGDNKVVFTPKATQESARFMVVGTIEDKNSPLTKVLDYGSMVLTGFKNVSVQYSESNGTILPGYMPGADFMGTQNGFTQPGVPFIFGFQDREFAAKSANKDWLTSSESFNSPYEMTHSNDFNIRTSFEPINGLKLNLTATRRYSKNMEEYYLDGGNDATGTMYSGAFSMSYCFIGTSFDKVGTSGSYESPAYDKFLENRAIVAGRMAEKRVGRLDVINSVDYVASSNSTGANGYSLNSQEVLIPAFLSAYSNNDAGNIFLDAMPALQFIQPNWRFTYDGLSKLDLFKKVMKSFDITHSYTSTYSVGSYATNLDYSAESNGMSWVRDYQGDFIPEFTIGTVSINEQFSPLLGLNVTWTNSLTTKVEMKRGRVLNLSLTNNQLTENYTKEWVVGLGYRFDKLAIVVGNKSFKSDLNLRCDVSLRDNVTLIRKISEAVDQLSAGQKVVTVKFTADYALSDRFNLQLYFDTNSNNPYISSAYPTKTTNYGLSFQFTLAQ